MPAKLAGRENIPPAQGFNQRLVAPGVPVRWCPPATLIAAHCIQDRAQITLYLLGINLRPGREQLHRNIARTLMPAALAGFQSRREAINASAIEQIDIALGKKA